MSRTRTPIPFGPAGRSVHLVDLDNLVGGPWNPQLVPQAMAAYLAASGHRAGDHVHVAADARLAASAAFEMPVGAQFLVGRGTDGADRRLLEVATPEHIAARYDRLVIGSGDGAFASLADEARRLGTEVVAIAPHGSLARATREAADHVVLLPRFDTASGA